MFSDRWEELFAIGHMTLYGAFTGTGDIKLDMGIMGILTIKINHCPDFRLVPLPPFSRGIRTRGPVSLLQSFVPFFGHRNDLNRCSPHLFSVQKKTKPSVWCAAEALPGLSFHLFKCTIFQTCYAQLGPDMPGLFFWPLTFDSAKHRPGRSVGINCKPLS